MPDHTKRFRSSDTHLIPYETTITERGGDLKPLVKTLYMAKTIRRPKPTQLDLESLNPYTERAKIPFTLYHSPKEVKKNPREVQSERYYDKPIEGQRCKVQKARSRVLLPPAVAMDDIQEPLRQMFTNYLYTSEMVRAMNNAVARPRSACKALLTEVYPPTNPLTIEPLLEPYISSEWRLDACPWKKRQVRFSQGPNKKLGLTKTPNCPARKNSARTEAKKRRR